MNDAAPSSADAPALHCFGGAPAPALVTEGFQHLLALPEHAIRGFWPVLEPVLQDPQGAEHAERLRTVAQYQGVDPGLLVSAVRSCDYLLRQAAAMGVSAEDFQQDLEQLCAGNPAPVQMLMPRFEATRDWLRNQILADTLADHGNVLQEISWRVDQVHASHRGVNLDAPVVFLGLRYRNGNDTQGLSLQLTPDSVRLLRALCDQFEAG